MPDLALEKSLHADGFRLVAGVDEAGRGPLAGPVTAAAVILPPGVDANADWLATVDDSKRLPAARRAVAAERVRANAIAWAVEEIAPSEIDRIGIGQAVLQAMFASVAALRPAPDALLLDWVPIRHSPLPYQTIVKGDAKSMSIAAASILAKVSRDDHMVRADRDYPGYGFARHKGYATAHHLSCLREMGPTPIHRRSFRPLRQARLISAARAR